MDRLLKLQIRDKFCQKEIERLKEELRSKDEDTDWFLELIDQLYKMNTIEEVRVEIDECITNHGGK